MRITIESTSKIVGLIAHGASTPARIWEGHTESGVPVQCFITRIALAQENPSPEDVRKFEADLIPQAAPSAAVEYIPLRLVL